jgi:hypothetical protein
MNSQTSGNRALRRAGPLAVVAAVAVLGTACSAGVQQVFTAQVSFARCMRSHGVPDYPAPTLKGDQITLHLKASGIDIQSSQFQVRGRECQHLLPAGVPVP